MIRVNLGPRSYDIAVNDTDGFGTFAAARLPSRTCLIICDANVRPIGDLLIEPLQASGFQTHITTIPPGEASKSLATVAKLYDWLAMLRADRQTAIIAVGGGMVGDLAGFVAATYNRGLPWIMAPTTLLSMVDSSVGGKVGVNLAQGKNLVGAFHQPAGVWIQTQALTTLDDAEYRSGLAEVVKYGVILDDEFFSWLEHNVDAINRRDDEAIGQMIERCCQLKAQIVELDEHETTGKRIVLNYGHTFAHAFESVSKYAIRHGEAVAMGMICASRLAEQRGMIGHDVTQRQSELLKQFDLSPEPPVPPRIDEWLAAMKQDNKVQAGRLRFIVPTKIGDVHVIDDVDEAAVKAVLGL